MRARPNIHRLPPLVDLVLTWTEMERHKRSGRPVYEVGTAQVWRLLGSCGVNVCARNHLNEKIELQVPVIFDGEPSAPEQIDWPVLYRSASTVWKVSKAIRTEQLHAHVTIVGVPEPAPWTRVKERPHGA